MSEAVHESASLTQTANSLPLTGERVTFTGTLASMTHQQAAELVQTFGGLATEHISHQTTMLVVGEEGWPLDPDGRPSQKLQHAETWKQTGSDIRIVSESDWLHLLGLHERRQEVHRLHTPAMLSKLLEIPVGVIRSWERAGVIRAVRRVYRLPYFDYQEVTGVRRLVQLLAAGVPRREIEAGLAKLSELLPGVNRPLAQLEVLARDARLVYRDDRGLVQARTGQRLLDYGGGDDADDAADVTVTPGGAPAPTVAFVSETPAPPRTADEWFREGCRLAEENDLEAAINAYRLALLDSPTEPEIHFCLAETLYRAGNPNAALERFFVAAELDNDYLEAWTQVGCVSAELGDLTTAIDAFRVALDLHPDCPDAHFHLAEALEQLRRGDEAAAHWESYLRFDSRGPWADRARQRLARPETADSN